MWTASRLSSSAQRSSANSASSSTSSADPAHLPHISIVESNAVQRALSDAYTPTVASIVPFICQKWPMPPTCTTARGNSAGAARAKSRGRTTNQPSTAPGRRNSLGIWHTAETWQLLRQNWALSKSIATSAAAARSSHRLMFQGPAERHCGK